MTRRSCTLAPLAALALLLLPQMAAALPGAETLTRPLALGGAFRAWGGGNGSLYFNPSTISQSSTYSVEGTYLNLGGDNILTTSVVDTKTSAVGAGFAYTYVPVSEAEDDHEVRLALSMGLVPGVLNLGINGRYAWLGETDKSGLSLDAGTSLNLGRWFALGAVAHNLMPNDDIGASRSYGFGAAFIGPIVAGFDLVVDPELEGADALSYHGGLEVMVSGAYPVRLGYENHPVDGSHYLCMGLALLSPRAGLQFSFRQRLDDSSEQALSFSLNMFL